MVYLTWINGYTSGASVNAVCRHSSTSSAALHLAAIAGDKQVLQMLLDCGARTWARDANMATPLHKAIEYQNENVVLALLTAKRG